MGCCGGRASAHAKGQKIPSKPARQAILITYKTPREGLHAVTGASGTPYGKRANGGRFHVFDEDVIAEPQRFKTTQQIAQRLR